VIDVFFSSCNPASEDHAALLVVEQLFLCFEQFVHDVRIALWVIHAKVVHDFSKILALAPDAQPHSDLNCELPPHSMD